MTRARLLRTTSLIVPSLLAALVTLQVQDERLLHEAAPVLVGLWVIMAGALLWRVSAAKRLAWDQLDVLTATGHSVMWLGAGALIASGLTGWASLSVIGVLGLGTVYLTATWTALIAGGDEPWANATIVRAVLPEVAVEGDPLREELRLAGVKIPSGMRLFATGRAMRHGVATRYVLGSEASGAEVTAESELGPALRGDHHAPPLTLWLGDVLGLSRTPAHHHGAASFSVMPRPVIVDGVRELLGAGGDDAVSRPANQLPTEGTFRIRDYVPGDDTRRIHWVRSLQRNQLVVRLPDELPPAEPAIRLILDNELWGTESLSCRAPDELLDALVRVWLGVAKALADTGTRVTLVTATEHTAAGVPPFTTPVEPWLAAGLAPFVTAAPAAPRFRPIEQALHARSMRTGLALGAHVAWQHDVSLATLVERHAAKQVVVSSRPRSVRTAAPIAWVVVPERAWTHPESPFPTKSAFRLPFPVGSAENRRGRGLRERRRIQQLWDDRGMFSDVVCWTDWTRFSGSYVARPDHGRVALAVIP